jgi:hypothetical protein
VVFINLFPFKPISTIKHLTIIRCFHVYRFMYIIVIPLPFQHMFYKYLMILKFLFHQIFLNHAITTHFNNSENLIYVFPIALDIQIIGCTRDDEMHTFVFFCL